MKSFALVSVIRKGTTIETLVSYEDVSALNAYVAGKSCNHIDNAEANRLQAKGMVCKELEFIKSGLATMHEAYREWMYDSGCLDAIERCINGSRIVFLNKKGKFTTVGQWIHKDGLLYSNSSYSWSLTRR